MSKNVMDNYIEQLSRHPDISDKSQDVQKQFESFFDFSCRLYDKNVTCDINDAACLMGAVAACYELDNMKNIQFALDVGLSLIQIVNVTDDEVTNNKIKTPLINDVNSYKKSTKYLQLLERYANYLQDAIKEKDANLSLLFLFMYSSEIIEDACMEMIESKKDGKQIDKEKEK